MKMKHEVEIVAVCRLLFLIEAADEAAAIKAAEELVKAPHFPDTLDVVEIQSATAVKEP